MLNPKFRVAHNPTNIRLCSEVFIVNFEHISVVSVVDIEQVNVSWEKTCMQ